MVNKPDFIQGILLAAGHGRRFGGNKLLHRLPDGELLGLASAKHLRQALPNALAVLRPEDRELRLLLEGLSFTLVIAREANRGMGHSLAAGVAATPNAAGWVIALADMPFVLPSTIAALAEALRAGHEIVAPVYRGRRGNPVGFSARYRDELLALEGDAGARRLLQTNPQHLHLLEVDDPGVAQDIDTPEDLDQGANASPAGYGGVGETNPIPGAADPAQKGGEEASRS